MFATQQCVISDWISLLISYQEGGGASREDLGFLAKAILARSNQYELYLFEEEKNLIESILM
jgi:hypothetical protein